MPTQNDNVNHPAHYTSGTVEVIDIIQGALSEEEFIGFLKGNVIKYTLRANFKGKHDEDLAKAQWYLNRYLSGVETSSE